MRSISQWMIFLIITILVYIAYCSSIRGTNFLSFIFTIARRVWISTTLHLVAAVAAPKNMSNRLVGAKS
jgi:hypothetical protein